MRREIDGEKFCAQRRRGCCLLAGCSFLPRAQTLASQGPIAVHPFLRSQECELGLAALPRPLSGRGSRGLRLRSPSGGRTFDTQARRQRPHRQGQKISWRSLSGSASERRLSRLLRTVFRWLPSARRRGEKAQVAHGVEKKSRDSPGQQKKTNETRHETPRASKAKCHPGDTLRVSAQTPPGAKFVAVEDSRPPRIYRRPTARVLSMPSATLFAASSWKNIALKSTSHSLGIRQIQDLTHTTLRECAENGSALPSEG